MKLSIDLNFKSLVLGHTYVAGTVRDQVPALSRVSLAQLLVEATYN